MRGSRKGIIAAGAFLLASLIPLLAFADVVRDGTLGPARSTQPTGPNFLITEEMGERPGSGPNLFHSFQEFSFQHPESVSFTLNDPSVANILTRVTGLTEAGDIHLLRSEINGSLSAPANLYLMNPAGMVFGESASLHINGSFHATTADYIGLGAGGERFYADLSRTSLLSSAPPSAFGFLGGGAADDGLAAITVEGASLQVQDGESLSFVGRDVGSGGVEISGAHLLAAGGRIDLVSVGSAGEVRLGEPGSPEPLDVSSFEALGALDIVSGASVEVSGDPPGSVWIRGGRLVVEGTNSGVLAVNQGSDERGGRISIAASESVLVRTEAPRFRQDVLIDAGTEASGPGGKIDVTAPELTIERGRVTSSAATASAGDAGTVHLDVGTLVIRNGYGLVAQQLVTPIGVTAETRGSGAGGKIEITAESVELTGRTAISAGSIGGSAGGKAGTIEIDAESLVIDDEAFVAAETAYGSSGDAGNIVLEVGTLRIDGTRGPNVRWPAFVSVGQADPGTSGKGGSIEIWAESIELVNGASIGASSLEGAKGSAGEINIEADSLQVLDGSNIAALAELSSTGSAGTISIDADSMLVQGRYFHVLTTGEEVVENAAINANTFAPGDGGTIHIEAGSLRIEDRGAIAANSFGTGNAGTITVEATDSVFISDAGGDRFSLQGVIDGESTPTGIYSGTVQGGHSGSISVSAPEITVTEGAVVATSTAGGGEAGDVTLRDAKHITISGGAFVDSTSVPLSLELPGGAAGSVTLVATESITVEGRGAFGDQSRVASATLGPSDAGSVTLRAPLIVVDDGAIATTSVPSPYGEGGRAGDIIILEAEELHVTGGGRVDSSSMTAGSAGTIQVGTMQVFASELLRVAGAGSGIATRTGGPGPGGDVELYAPRIEVSGGGKISAESTADPQETQATRDIFASLDVEGWIAAFPEEATGNAGSVKLQADQVLVHRGSIATHSEEADGGDVITHATERLHLIDGEMTAGVRDASGGNIVIDPVFVILEGESRIVATAHAGEGGNISITADVFLASPESVISADSELGIQGTVEIHAPETDVAGTLASLPETFLDAAALMKERCAARKGGESAGSFVWTGRQGVSWSPDGMIPASYQEAEEGPEPAGLVLGTSSETGERVALLVGCGGGGESSRR